MNNISINRTEKGFSINIKTENATASFDGFTKEEMESFREEIFQTIKNPKETVVRWNPRAKRHDIIEL